MFTKAILAIAMIAAPAVALAGPQVTSFDRQDRIAAVDRLISDLQQSGPSKYSHAMVDQLRSDRASYISIGNRREFASTLSRDLRAIGHDGSVAVRVDDGSGADVGIDLGSGLHAVISDPQASTRVSKAD